MGWPVRIWSLLCAPTPRSRDCSALDNKLLPSRRDVIEYINDYLRREGLRTHSSTDLDTLLQQLPDPSGEIEDWPANLKNYIAEYRTLRRGKLEHELTSQKKRWLAGNPDDKQRERGAQGVRRIPASIRYEGQRTSGEICRRDKSNGEGVCSKRRRSY